MLTTTQTIINDIEGLRGSEVRIFAQPTKLSDTVDRFEIDIIDILRSLEGFEVVEGWTSYIYNDETEEEEEVDLCELLSDADDFLDLLEYYGYIGSNYSKCDNSYNWLAPVSNHFDFRVYDDIVSGGCFVEFKVHRFGDVRGNYTDSVIYHFDGKYAIDAFYECLYSCDKYERVEVDGVEYSIDVNVFSDGFEVYDADGDYICTAYGDEDDIIKAIEEAVA